jgi:putative spermidine/putrescine transport system permease protein
MTHIQLPFTLLPIYSVMKTISPTMRAAKSLEVRPSLLPRVYMPHLPASPPAAC